MDKDKVISMIRKLLSLAQNNNNEAEAELAMLKAQELMAKNDIKVDFSKPEEIEYVSLECEHKWDCTFKNPLAQVIAQNFRCMMWLWGKQVMFMGHELDTRIAKETFEFAYDFIRKNADRICNKHRKQHGHARGVFNSYSLGFIHGLKAKLESQSHELALIVPPDVVNKFNEMTDGWKESKSRMTAANLNRTVFDQGYRDGQSTLNQRRLSN